jgi:biopolymer transport protein ExbD
MATGSEIGEDDAAELSTVDVGVDLPVSTAAPQPRPQRPLFLKADLALALGDHFVTCERLAQTMDTAS